MTVGEGPERATGEAVSPTIVEKADVEKADKDEQEEEERQSVETVASPAKVMRIGTMVKQLLEEVRQAQLDEASRNRMREIYSLSIKELSEGLSPDLAAELERIALPFSGDTPSESELRVAQAQLVGWLEGLFHGIQATLFAQQMAARSQLMEMRRGLPAPHREASDRSESSGTGLYL